MKISKMSRKMMMLSLVAMKKMMSMRKSKSRM